MPPRPTPPRATPLRLTLVKLEKSRKKLRRGPQRGNVGTVPSREMFPRSNTITATRRAIMPRIASSQKTSGSLDDLQGPCKRIPYIWYPVRSKVIKQGPWPTSVARKLIARPWRPARKSPQVSHSRIKEKTKEMKTWPQSVRDIQLFLDFRDLIEDFIES